MSLLTCLVVAVSVVVAVKQRTPSATPDPLWNPIDPRLFASANPSDTVIVQYVTAPLLKAEVGPIFGYFDLYHGGLAFTVVEQNNFTWVVNFDSVDLDLFGSQLPSIVKSANGTRSLVWQNAGAAYCYAGIHGNYWTAFPGGVINGTAYNAYVQQFLIPFNSTWKYYEMFNVRDGDPGTVLLYSHECFDFVAKSFAFLNALGANVHGTMKRNLVYWTADGNVTEIDMSDAKTAKKVVDFYELLELHWGSVSSIGQFLALLGDLLLGDLFYLHVGQRYYQFQLQWPVLSVDWKAVSY